MIKKEANYLLFIILLFLSIPAVATTRKVLFIGNSFTFTNNMPSMLDSMVSALGDTLIFDMSAIGGYTFEQQTTNPTTISKIFSQQWDIVVLQEQSELPAFPPAQVDTQVYPYAAILDSMVRANDSCTQTMFLMTWGHANGDPPNCPSYPVICTYDGMQERLRESYLQMGIDNHACVAPVGSAFKIMMDSMYTPWLYNADSTHPVVPGSYLEAAVLYSSIYHKSTINCTYTAGISATDVYTLQRVATKVVFDSLNQWQQNGHYPYAGFGHSTAGGTVSFTSLSPIANHYTWSFGDLATATDANPVHTYTASGTYTVSNTAYTNCFTETLTDTVQVTIANTGITTINNSGSVPSFMEAGNGRLIISLPGSQSAQMDIYNCKGALVRHYENPPARIDDSFIPGFYFYRWYKEDGIPVETGKIVVY